MGKAETWIDRADRDLYGNGKPGIIQLFHESQAEQRGSQKTFKTFATLIGILTSMVSILEILERLHIIPR